MGMLPLKAGERFGGNLHLFELALRQLEYRKCFARTHPYTPNPKLLLLHKGDHMLLLLPLFLKFYFSCIFIEQL